MSKIALSGNASGTGTFTIASPNSNSDRTLNLPDNSGTVITTATTTGIDASALSTGTVAAARLGSGTPDATNFLRGDGSWQVISTTPTTAEVLTATAGASAGAVGTYALLVSSGLINASTTRTATGATIAGSSLRYSAVMNSSSINTTGGGTPSGTWRCMGIERNSDGSNNNTVLTLWLRIS
jgi:hypothetical protein